MTTSREKLIEGIMESFHVMRNKMHSKISQYGQKDCVTNSQLFVLTIIARHPKIGIKEIAKIFHISPSAATQLVDSLVENDYVFRKSDRQDRRVLQLGLSPKGLKHISILKKQFMKTAVNLLSGLSERELKTYLSLHKKILSGILDKK